MIDNQHCPKNYEIKKARAYYSYVQAINDYPELTNLSRMDILRHICLLYESLINSIVDKKETEAFEIDVLHYEYAIHGLFPAYQECGDEEILKKCLDELLLAEKECHNYDFNRDICVAKARVFLYLNQFSLAQDSIVEAYNDFDYRVGTFTLLMTILDKTKQFELMIEYAKEYCGKFSKLHEKICFSSLGLENINKSHLFNDLKQILGE